jgi:hypothetical protein
MSSQTGTRSTYNRKRDNDKHRKKKQLISRALESSKKNKKRKGFRGHKALPLPKPPAGEKGKKKRTNPVTTTAPIGISIAITVRPVLVRRRAARLLGPPQPLLLVLRCPLLLE